MADGSTALSIPILKTKRLELRAFEQADLSALYRLFTDEQVIPMFGYRMNPTLDAAQDVLERWEAQRREGTGIRWAICLGDELIGQAGLKNIRAFHRCAELGYALLPDFWGKGLGTEALLPVVQHGFETMRLNRIEATVFTYNTASEGLLKKLGFDYEGTLKSYYRFDDIFQDGRMWARITDLTT